MGMLMYLWYRFMNIYLTTNAVIPIDPIDAENQNEFGSLLLG